MELEKPISTPSELQLSDRAMYLQNVTWRGLEALIESPDFDPSPKWIAKKLNTTVEKAVDAIEGLTRLGVIQKSESTYVKATKEKSYYFGPDKMDRAELLMVHKRLTHQTLTKLGTQSMFSNWFFLADDELLAKYSPKFVQLYKDMLAEGLEKGCTQVVASEISFASLTDSKNGGHQ